MTAGFYPKITAALAMVPAGCDMLGPAVGRRGGCRSVCEHRRQGSCESARGERYFDVANLHLGLNARCWSGLV